MIQEQKVLIGKMDRENSPETVNMYDYLEAHNIRNVGNDESDGNYVTNLEGTVLVSTSLPNGESRCIGSKSFEIISKAYFVRFNSEGSHQIVEYDYNNNLETVLFENLLHTGGKDIFGWSSETYFSDIRLVHEKFLVLNNSENEIYHINIQQLKNKPVGKVYTEDDLLLIVAPPLSPPTALYANDSQRTTNALRGNLFQFRTQYVYSDYRESAWSTVSKRVVPINEPANGQGQSVGQNNAMIVTIKLENDRVETINIGLRSGLNNWLLHSEVSVAYIKALPETNISIDYQGNRLTTNKEAYNPVTKEYKFVFYNEGLYPVLDQVEVENPYDAIPHKAETVEVINGNMLAVGGITEGYDKPLIEDLVISVGEYRPNLGSNISGGTDFDYSHREYYTISGRQGNWYRIVFKGTPRQGDQIRMKHKKKDQITWAEYSYTVTQADELNGMTYTLQKSGNYFTSQKASGTGSVEGFSNYYECFDTWSKSSWELEFYIIRKDIGMISTQSLNTLKSNSSYQLALEYTDGKGRYFELITDDRFIVNTKSLTETQGLLSQINWTIQSEAPEGAVSYQWLLSENQKYSKSIYLTGKIDNTETDQNYIGLEVKSLERFLKNENESQINYTFTKGDKVVVMYATNGQTNSITDWFRYPFIELDIVGFEVKEDAQNQGQVKYLLKVRRTSLLNKNGSLSYLNDKDIMLELYTPKQRDIASDRILFYEVGEQYPIIDGKHSVISGGIREGDWYYRGRLYESNTQTNTPLLYEVEDPNFSDNYESKYWSAGRARTAVDEQGKTTKKASIRYSDEYIYGSRFNGLNRFYLERIYGEAGGQTTSKDGAIKKLEMRGNSLVCIQEFKVGVIPVYKAIIFDNTDTSLVADSGKIFGSIQYRVGNYGCGNAKESIAVSRDGVIYFFDSNSCLPLRDSLSGLDVIDVNMTTYFTKYAREAKVRGSKFIGYYDSENKEYNLTIEDTEDRLITIYFEDKDIEYKDSYIPPYGDIVVTQPSHGSLVLNGYEATYTPVDGFIGADIVSFSFDGKNKNATFLVEQGNRNPQQIIFEELVNQPLSSLVESSEQEVIGTNTRLQVTISGGQYRVNGGAWTSATSFVREGDKVQVRHTTSASFDTEVITTLTIGNTSNTFRSKTVPQGVDPSQYLYIRFEITQPTPQTGTSNKYGVKSILSHPIVADYNAGGEIEYRSFGAPVSQSFSLTVPQGSTEADTGYIVTNADPVGTLVNGVVTVTSIKNEDIVDCQDGVKRIARVSNYFEI